MMKGNKEKEQATAASTSEDTSKLQQQLHNQPQQQQSAEGSWQRIPQSLVQLQAAWNPWQQQQQISQSQPQQQVAGDPWQQQQVTGGSWQQQPQQQIAGGPWQQQPQQQVVGGPWQQQPQQQVAGGPWQQQRQQQVAGGPWQQQPQQQVAGGPWQQQPQQQQSALVPRQQIPQSQPQLQAAWNLRQQQSQDQLQQQQQRAWGPRQQISQSQSQLQAAWNLRQQQSQDQLQQQQQRAWGPRQQIPQSQPQLQAAWNLRQQQSQDQLQQQQQRAWGPRQQIPQSQPQLQAAWNLRQQQSQDQLQQQQQRAWGPRQQVAETQSQQQQQLRASGLQQVLQQQTTWDLQKQILQSHQQQPSTSTAIDVSELGSTEPFTSTEKTKISSAQLASYYEMIPKRKHPEKGGSIGIKIDVWTNMFRILFDDKFVTNAVHYDITVKPYKQKEDKKEEVIPKLPKGICRNIFEKFRIKHFNDRYPAYDGKKNAYSANDLPVDDMADIFEHVNENGRRNQYQIIIKKAANIDLSWIKNLRPGFVANRYQAAVQVLDIIMRHAPEYQFVNIGRSLFWNMNEDEPLGGGLVLARGGFMSGILGWKPYLNVDVSHKGFTMKQGVLTNIANIVKVSEEQLTYENITHYETNCKIQSFLKGLKVDYEIPKNNLSKRTHRIIKLSGKNSYSTFDQETENGKQKTTIEQYFLNFKKYTIKRPDLPTLHVSTKADGSEILLPIELCTIVPNQPIRRLNEEQTSNMIKKTTTDALTRKERIENAFRTIQVNSSPVMTQEFHLSVNGEMEKIPARILPAPELKYGGRKVQVRKGTWNLQLFNEAKHLEKNSWTIVNWSGMPKIDSAMQEFMKMLQSTAKEVGMVIQEPSTPFKSFFGLKDLNNIKRYFNDNRKLKLIIVIIPNRTDMMYSKVKKITEMEVGVLTQCMKVQTLRKLNQFKQTATVKNILLKINSKLNGVNHIFDRMPSCLNEQYPCMLVGADVTHPSPDSKHTPSIAAVAASRDKSAFRYNIELRLQQPKEEMILDLKQIILSQLGIYVQETKCLPKRIVYYRDGVSEGQLPQVMYYEIENIKKAISEFTHRGAKGNIEITCLVVQKRHHVRLFPTREKDQIDPRTKNVLAGTLVDTHITHPDHIDFYLVSHASIQGTARPAKYRCIWNESDFTEDQLEELTYYLCHMYARCARSVSYPAPTYYAHLAAYRGRALIPEKVELNDLETEQRNFIIKMEQSPMFFV